MAQEKDDLEKIFFLLGDFGPYQLRQYLFHTMASLTAGIHIFSLVIIAAVPEHRCEIPILDNLLINDTTITNKYLPTNNISIFNNHIPKTLNGQLEKCYIYRNISEDNSTIPCEKWVYDSTYYQSSRAIEWDFVCDRQWMKAAAQSAYMFGVLIGTVTLGSLSDKIGRKPVFCWCGLFQLILAVGVSFVNDFHIFLIVTFLYGLVGSAGAYISAFVLTMELIGPSKRTICGIVFQTCFVIGIMLDAFWGYLIKDRFLLQIIYGLHALLLIPQWWLMDESPRWLWSKGKLKESIEILQNGLKLNKNKTVLDLNYYEAKLKQHSEKEMKSQNASEKDISKKTANMMDLFKTPNLRYKTLNLCLCFTANSLCYYGLSLGTGSMEGNPYLNMFLMALVEMPANLLVVLTLDKFGRRSLTSGLMLFSGCFYLISSNLDKNNFVQLITVLIMLSKLAISGSFSIIYNYSAEIFPTTIRNTAIGLGSMFARVGGISAPFILLLENISPKLPSVVFGFTTLLSGFLILFLPETNGQPLPQTLEDGENFGAGDTCFSTGFKKNKFEYAYGDKTIDSEQIMPLEPIKK